MFCFQIFLLLAGGCLLDQVTGKALDDYIAKPDDVFGYEELSDYDFRDEEYGVTVYILNMTSQQWKTEEVIDQSIWFHYMAVIVPDDLAYTAESGLFISLGDNDDGPPNMEDDYFLTLAVQAANKSRAVVTMINQVPNQPIVFASDPTQRSRSEDSIIGYTWRRFLIDEDASDPEILVLFPMTKAVIRAMDVIQEYASEKLGQNIERFALTGPSKRGWTTYLAAATDPKNRVFAIAPMVFSVLNSIENLHRHFRSLGGWSWAMRPYWRENITHVIDSPNAVEMMDHLDPFAYRDRLTMPMYVFQASGDEFFHLDEPNLWWSNMTNERYLLLLENSNHPMIGHHDRLIDNFSAMFIAIVENFKRPVVSWELQRSEGKGSIIFQTDTEPKEIYSYWSNTTSGERRDFRLLVVGPDGETDLNPVFWEEGTVRELGEGRYEAEYEEIEDRWLGFFIYARFPGPDGREFEMTTEVNIIPDTFPFPRCSGEGCRGSIV